PLLGEQTRSSSSGSGRNKATTVAADLLAVFILRSPPRCVAAFAWVTHAASASVCSCHCRWPAREWRGTEKQRLVESDRLLFDNLELSLICPFRPLACWKCKKEKE